MVQEPLTEEELQALVLLAQEGDTQAFEKLYEHFFLPIYRYTAFRAPAELVEDVVADVFVKTWEKLHQYRQSKGIPFGAWLFRIARHAVIDTYRKERAFEEVGEELADPDELNRADARVKNKDVVRVVRKALNALPKRYRDVLLLSYIADLPTAEVARVMRKTEGGIRILRFRALRKLEKLLPSEMRE